MPEVNLEDLPKEKVMEYRGFVVYKATIPGKPDHPPYFASPEGESYFYVWPDGKLYARVYGGWFMSIADVTNAIDKKVGVPAARTSTMCEIDGRRYRIDITLIEPPQANA